MLLQLCLIAFVTLVSSQALTMYDLGGCWINPVAAAQGATLEVTHNEVLFNVVNNVLVSINESFYFKSDTTTYTPQFVYTFYVSDAVKEGRLDFQRF
jgi:hypothetical protein